MTFKFISNNQLQVTHSSWCYIHVVFPTWYFFVGMFQAAARSLEAAGSTIKNSNVTTRPDVLFLGFWFCFGGWICIYISSCFAYFNSRCMKLWYSYDILCIFSKCFLFWFIFWISVLYICLGMWIYIRSSDFLHTAFVYIMDLLQFKAEVPEKWGLLD